MRLATYFRNARLACVFLLFFGANSTLYSQEATKFYVSPEGKDSWSGLKPSRSFIGKGGPFRTFNRALDAARSASKPATIVLANGTYFLEEPVILGHRDSGLTIEGEGRISGGKRITDWYRTRFNGREVFAARVGGMRFQELWVDGRRAIRARHPDVGYFRISELPDKTTEWQDGQARFKFSKDEVGRWGAIDPLAKVVVMNRWVESHLPFRTIDLDSKLVSFKKRSVWQLGVGDPYYVEGVAEVLDSAGEWFLDSREQIVYYVPLEGESVREIEVIAPVLSEVLRIEGNGQENGFAESITIKGLTFSHAEFVYPEAVSTNGSKLEAGGAVQAAYTVPGAVRVSHARNIKFEGCRFLNLGTYALELGAGCVSNRIEQCEFADLAGGGIKIGTPGSPSRRDEFTGYNVIADNRIHDGGKVFHSAVGIWIGQSPGNTIEHNSIYNFYYTGISIGWTWGYGSTMASNNLVAFNEVHHIGRKSNGDGPILSDMGGIYTLGMQPGTRILNNVWHDIDGLNYGGWGIYFDEGSSSIVATSNLVYRTTHGGFHQHYGATNTVVNNIFAFARDHQIQRSRSEPHVSFYFKTNIVVIDQGVFLGANWGGLFESDGNIFFDTRGGGESKAAYGGRTLQAWQASGHDQGSVYVDPGFVNAAAYDFRLKSDSGALKQGFRPLDLSTTGPRKRE